MGKNNSHAVDMVEHNPLLHARAQRSTPNSEPRGETKARLYRQGADLHCWHEDVGWNVVQSGKRGLTEAEGGS